MDRSNGTQASNADAEMTARPGGKVTLFIMATAFLSAMGIGIISPVIPFITQSYLRGPLDLATTIGWLASSYAICQFLATPVLGALSDHYGRRPVLLVCLWGSVAGYMIFGIGGALWVLFLGRIIDGLTGGNSSILAAYIADVCPPEGRSKYYGMVGAAFGAGFIAGPLIGGVAAQFGYSAPLFVAAAITAVNALWGHFNLPESLDPANRQPRISLRSLNPFVQFRELVALPRLRWMLLAIFLYSFPFAALQTNAAVFSKEVLHWGPGAIASLYLLVGVTDIISQGGLVRWLLPVLGEVKLVILGLSGEIAGYLLIAAVVLWPSPGLMAAGIFVLVLGEGLIGPPVSGLLSKAAAPGEQGRVQGGAQAIESLSRVTGPPWGGALYDGIGKGAPYIANALLSAAAIVAVSIAVPELRAVRPSSEAAPSETGA